MNADKDKVQLNNTSIEQKILKRSIYCTLIIAATGILFGLLCGSMSIVFDGMFSALDAGMCSLSLFVSRLLSQPLSRRFQYGFLHVEPLVLAFNGSLLTLLCMYAFINAVKGIFDGGRELDLGWALLYAVTVSVFCFFFYLKQRKINKKIRSGLIALDTKSWLMSACISSALLVAFFIYWLLEGTKYEYFNAYTDPVALAILTLLLIPVPMKTVISAGREILQITPLKLDCKLESIMAQLTLEYGFLDYSNYATRVGRGLFIEIHIVIPECMENIGVKKFDLIRERIANAIGEEGPHRWLTISFTRNSRWL
jgi:predicted Co/Zn/Cd cation transporter (cation efflux family)